MIELPEAIVYSQQLNYVLSGKIIKEAIVGQNPHRFAFMGSLSPDEMSEILFAKSIVKCWADGNLILIELHPDHILSLGCGGERILYHPNSKKIPKKHQLLLKFTDNSSLSVTVSGWGELRILMKDELPNHPHIKSDQLDPLSQAFNYNRFETLIEKLPSNKMISAKYFYITDPGLKGIGNGVIQDIFYYAKIHPKRDMKTLSLEEKQELFHTTKSILTEMVKLGGRNTEIDIYGDAGGYIQKITKEVLDTSCSCGSLFVKKQYLGGSVYFCPSCQPLHREIAPIS